MVKLFLLDKLVTDLNGKKIHVSQLRHGGESICELIKKEFSKEFKIEVIESIYDSNIEEYENNFSDGFIIWPLTLFPENLVEIKNIFQRSKFSLFDFWIFPFNVKSNFLNINASILKKNNNISFIYIKSNFNYKSEDEALKIRTKAILEFKTEASFFALKSPNPTSRSFNQIQLKGKWFEKKSSQSEKIKNEFHFINNLPIDLKKFFPKISPKGLFESKNESSYLIEYLSGEDCANKAISNKFDKKISLHFHNFIYIWLKNVEKYNFSNGIFSSFLIEKCKSRLTTLNKKGLKNKLDNVCSFLKLPSTDESLIKITKNIDKNKLQLNSRPMGLYHGDLCLSNIIYHKNNFYLIDPRGFKGDQPNINIFYEFAKLRHSIISKYDILNMDLGTFQIDQNKSFSLINKHNDSFEFLKLIYFDLLENFGLDDNIIKVVEASLFFSMLPLHTENLTKILSFYLKFISLIDELNYE